MSETSVATHRDPQGGFLEELESVAIRFAGDSGDGMQLTGTQFTNTSAVLGNDVSTMPDFPAEIRAPAGLSNKEKDRCKNFFALGLTFWMYDRSLDTSLEWIEAKFGKKPEIAEANRRALKAGYYYGETTETFRTRYRVGKLENIPPGVYRKVTGNEAAAMGFVTAAARAGKTLFYGSYPITPASDILHELASYKHFDVRTFQAEDEIAAIGSAIGAAFGGAFALTGTSGPGICLKSEAMNLAVVLELPLVIADIQRGGPSTGLPTKTEQSDLLQVLFGRNGESPIPVIAPCSPADCFTLAMEAFRLAVRAMTPVVFLSDGFLANSAEPWRIPDPDELPTIEVHHRTDATDFFPYVRDEVTLSRPWV